MSRKTIVALALLAGLLGFAVWRQIRGEEAEKRSEDVALLEDVDPARVRRLTVENLEREKSMAFDRLEDGRWTMTEPIPMLADQGRVQRIFDILRDRRGAPLPPERAIPKELRLDPPRAIVEIEEEVAGTKKRTRVDLGALDLDGTHMVVRVGGRILRTWRDIDTAIAAGLDDFISHEVVDRPPRDVVEFHRRGTYAPARAGPEATPASTADLGFDALAEEGVWRATSPFSARLDPQGAAVFLQACLGLRGATFPDVGRRLLSEFGLDPAEITIFLGTASGRTLTLRLGRPTRDERSIWHCVLEGRPVVWTIDDASLGFLTAPARSFVDSKLVRIPPPEIDGLSLALDGRELRLWRVRGGGPVEGRWLAAERPGAESAFSASLPADLKRVEDLIGRVANLEIANVLEGPELARSEVRGSIVVQAKEEHQGGEIGGDFGDPERGRAVRIQRTGDTVAGLVDPGVLDLLKTPLAEVLSLVLVDVPEIDLVGLSIQGAGVRRTFVRGSKGLWTPPDVAVEARELHPILDGITILRAMRYVAGEALLTLAEPIVIELTASNQDKTRFTVGVAPDAAEGERVQAERDGRRVVAKDQGLHARLLAVLKSGG